MKKLIIVLICLTLLTGCATTQTSQMTPLDKAIAERDAELHAGEIRSPVLKIFLDIIGNAALGYAGGYRIGELP